MPERPMREAMLNMISELRAKVYGEEWHLQFDLLEKRIELAIIEANLMAVCDFANSLGLGPRVCIGEPDA